ncbi:hypothetical protein JQ625_27545 [Bradyrhizobium diazoefficiens]|nr:hypothetical protein [Bradyrhizobium diazoefficiens]MBR0778604.1 hypothetical protein [Bradyrhizobium diazoefficiens]
MKWIRERDALIAQTMAFIQSVTGKKDGLHSPGTETAAFAVTTEFVAVRTVAVEAEPPPASPAQPLPVQIVVQAPVQLAPPRASDFRSEMQDRIANFRKHQERFEREREEYCAATLSKVRAAIREAPSDRPAEK